MPLPGTQEIRRPLLEAFKGEAPRNFSINEMLEIIAEYYGLNLNDFSSGDKNILRSRINEAKSDLKKNNLLYNPSGNTYMITNAGTEILEGGPEIISDEYLKERRKKPLPLSETLGIKPVKTRNEPEILPEIDTDSQPDSLAVDTVPDIETPANDETLPEADTESQPDSLAVDTVPDIETPANDETLPEIDTESQPDSQAVDAVPDIETPASDENLPEIDTDSQPDSLAVDTVPDIETPANDDTLPEIDTESQQDSQAVDVIPDIETPANDETLPELDTESQPDSQAVDAIPDVETSTDDETPPELDTESQPDSQAVDAIPDVETSTDDETPPEADTESQPDSLTVDMIPNIETSTDDETLPEDDTESQQDSLAVDAVTDIETPAGDETLTEFDTESQEDSQADDTLTEDFAGKESDEAPEEILDTEEVYNQMPEDMYEPDETQEDLTPETEQEESQPEPEPEESEHEEEYDPEILSAAIPSNSIDDVIARYNSELADELLMKAAGLPSDRFEMLVIDLLSKMGYFAFQTARYTTESSGSDMIHGVILDNKTGANIYIQARKLYPGKTIGKADIQDFIDELADKGGKGIYATTANFSENAQILAADERLMLIDGVKLANLMIANNFCVNVEKVYEIKSIDTESFSEYE